jgi:hypothetical protein
VNNPWLDTYERKERRREQVRHSCRRWRRKNRDKHREDSRRRDAANPANRAERNARFEANNPAYWREYYHRRKLRVAWRAWTRICALSRQSIVLPINQSR